MLRRSEPESCLCRGVALLGGATIPRHCDGIVFGDTHARAVCASESYRRVGVTLLDGIPIPPLRIDRVLGSTITVTVGRFILDFRVLNSSHLAARDCHRSGDNRDPTDNRAGLKCIEFHD